MIRVGIGSVANARWINHMAVEFGSICVLQGTKSNINGSTTNTLNKISGILKQASDIGTAFWTVVRHLYYWIPSRTSSLHLESRLSQCIHFVSCFWNWNFGLLCFGQPLSGGGRQSLLWCSWALQRWIQDEGVPFVSSILEFNYVSDAWDLDGISGYWCWISPHHRTERLTYVAWHISSLHQTHMFPPIQIGLYDCTFSRATALTFYHVFQMFLAAFFSLVLYTLIFLRLRGNVVRKGWHVHFRRTGTADWQGRKFADDQTMAVARHMLL